MISSMIFFPDATYYETPDQYKFVWEDVRIPVTDDTVLAGWYLKADEERGVMLHLHGNAGNISGRLSKVQGWVDRGISVLLIDYRAYGKSTGKIKHEEDLVMDAEYAFNWLKKEKGFKESEIIVFGESLGSYPAIRLASKFEPKALILEAPFTSFVDLAPIHYSMIPGFIVKQLLAHFEFSNVNNIDKIRAPLFIMHGTRDETCPYEMGEILFEKAPEPKGFLSIPGGGHNDLPVTADRDYWDKPFQFVKQLKAV